mgnify:FL=1|jgi:hypothetical protein
MVNQKHFEYKTVSISPVGIRIKGDDISEKLADLLNNRSNELAKKRWRLLSILPSLKSEGAVAKLLVTFERAVE